MFNRKTQHFRKIDLIGILLLISFLLPLLALAYIGLFTRYMADDYCIASDVNSLGFIQSQWVWYRGWTGRFSFTLLAGVVGSVGPRLLPLLPPTVLATWMTVMTWSVYQVAAAAVWPRPLLTSLVMSELVIFATLNSTHHLVQSLYWQSGMLTYIPPLILLSLYAGVACRAARAAGQARVASIQVIMGAVLTFMAGGFSEAYVLMQTGGLLLGTIICYKSAPNTLRRAVLPILVAGLVGSILATCIIVLAPGNAVRQSHFPQPPDPFRLTVLSLYYAGGFIPYTIYLSPVTVLLSVTLPALFGCYICQLGPGRALKPNPGSIIRLLAFSPAVGFALILLCTLPSIYGTSDFLPERARILPQFVLVGGAVLWGYLSGIGLSEWRCTHRQVTSWPLVIGSAAVVILVILSPFAAVVRTMSLISRAKEGASQWEQMDREVRAARVRGEMNVVVPAMDDMESRLGAHRTELQLERDARSTKNQCAARYYGVNSIRAE